MSHDGGTIGIAHWASGGLCKLYKNMDTQKYFGRSESEMCDNWASRYSGANSQQWWIDGFVDFVNSPESEAIQDKTFIESRQSAVDSAIEEGGWTPYLPLFRDFCSCQNIYKEGTTHQEFGYDNFISSTCFRIFF